MDNCCLNRPFDDQTDIRIHLEAESIKAIISLFDQQKWILISSQVLEFEISNTYDILRRNNLLAIIQLASETVEVINKLRLLT